MRGGTTVQRGTSVIGHTRDGYDELAEYIGANYFKVDDDAWSWALNQSFLDDAIARGDDFLLATPIDRIYPGGALEREVDYLLSHGYVLSPDGWALIAP